ncbi:hypothetical protein [Flavilitoribacter nigricans]|uniref:Uncharacterized protein n=1 Tax=Flavilitoribacter nigricans (strain ATCC 23147 / DSM 23189 / NBRC 102662 / NCIMB 1420 / SS-2) TaxID=1122177 RepID=A0A2D0N5U7_FLAN2|nr:hypothetical protein [Flavilitoribacter nigricans]PHN03874.1 hypothetical protein CRP01_23655 [Flavilitoribacter nigricans DSM 23189 = NBRC 102662]
MELYQILNELDQAEDVHLGRILILLNEFSQGKREKKIEGLTKLAKLDFLLRYPLYLERALIARRKSTKNVQILPHEKDSVESKMVRYKYGPWDFRYRKFINILIGLGLAYYEQEGKRINIGITPKGKEYAEKLLQTHSFDDVRRRAKLVKTNFDLSATSLMKFIYQTFPEIGSLDLGKEIQHEN